MNFYGCNPWLAVALCYLFLARTACADSPKGDDGHMEVRSGRDLAIAFASSSRISTAVLHTDVFMRDADWEGVLGGPNRNEPVLLSRNFTIMGSPSLPSWPLLNMGFVHAKVRIGNGVTLVVRHVVVGDFRSDLLTRAPGFDLAAPTFPGEPGRLLHNETAVFYLFCFPKHIWADALANATRSVVSPGNQTYRLSIPQPDCTNFAQPTATVAGSSSGSAAAITVKQLASALGLPGSGLKVRPALQTRCWADRGVFDDVAVTGFDIASNGNQVPNYYDTLLRNVTYMCANVMPMDCITSFGPLGCVQHMMANKPRELPWRLPPSSFFFSSSSSSSPSSPGQFALAGSPGPSPDPSLSVLTATRLEVWSGRDLAVAFAASPRIDTAVLMTDVWMAEEDWLGLLGGPNGSDPVLLSSNFTITGSPDLPTWPLLNMAFVRSKVRIASNVTLTVRHLVVGDFRYNLITQSPGFDLAAPTILNAYDNITGALLHNETAVMYSVCFPEGIWRIAVLNATRASRKPGIQSAGFGTSQDGCVNVTLSDPNDSATSASPAALAAIAAGTSPGLKLLPPLQSRCWTDRGAFIDVVVPGADVNVFGNPVPNNYDVLLQNVTYMCANVMATACIGSYGPLVCAAMLLNRTSDPLPWRVDPSKSFKPGTPFAAETEDGGNSSTVLAAVLGGVLGGLALLAVIAVAVYLGLRYRSRSRSKYGMPPDPEGFQANSKHFPADGLDPSLSGGGCLAWRAFVNPAPTTNGEAAACAFGLPGTTKSSSTATPSGESSGDSPNGLAAAAGSGADGGGGGGKDCADHCGGGDPPYTGMGFTGGVINGSGGGGGGGEESGGAGKGQQLASSTMQDTREDCGSGRPGAAPVSCASRSDDQTSNATSRSGDAFTLAAGQQQRPPTSVAPLNSQPCEDEHVVVTPLTLPRADLALGAAAVNEVTLLPVVRGKGAFGRVYEGMYSGVRVAVKVMRDIGETGAVGGGGGGDGGGGAVDYVRASFAQEVEVLGRCQHPNVVRLLAACVEPPRLVLVMELMETSLEKLVYNKAAGLMPLEKVLYIALDIARGLEYLHPTILHRDLKPANILINEPNSSRPIAKITDFGVSRLRSTVLVTKHPEAGTPAYMAPETFDVKNYTLTHHVDIYSLGVILWVLLTGEHPWKGLTMVEVAYKVTINRERLQLGAIPPSRSPPKLRALIEQCWEHEPRRRPAAAEIVKELQFIIDSLRQA